MHKDIDYRSCFLYRSKSLFGCTKTACLFAASLTLFLCTAQAQEAATDEARSHPLNIDPLNRRECNKNNHSASYLPDKKKQRKRGMEALSGDRTRVTFKCLTPVENIYADWVSKNNHLIDIRDPKEFKENKIPGTMNLPLHMVKYKEGLMNRNIVLVGRGFLLSRLEKSCSELKDKGFEKVSVMRDGLKAWGEVGYPIAGDKMGLQGLSDVTPSELVSAIDERVWAFIDLDHSSKGLPDLLSPASVIEYTGDYLSLKSKIDAFKATTKSGVIPGFLVISQDGNRNRIIKKRFLDSAIKDVYYLKGGVSRLKRFMQKQAAQVERLRKGFQVRMGCNG